MKKRILCTILAMGIATNLFAYSPSVKASVDGKNIIWPKEIKVDVEPIIINNYDEFYKAVKDTLETGKSKKMITKKEKCYDYFDTSNKIAEELGYVYLGDCWTSQISDLSYDSEHKIITIAIDRFVPEDKIVEMRQETLKKAKEIIETVIKPNMTDYDKELALHDYLLKNSQYDHNIVDGEYDKEFTKAGNNRISENKFFRSNPLPLVEGHSAYGVLVKGKGVCTSYSRAMQLLLGMVGIENKLISGNGAGNPHMWNLVKIDGNYYHLDPTFDDGQEVSHMYFNLDDDAIKLNHVWDEKIYPKCNNTKYSYYKLYPKLSESIYISDQIKKVDNKEFERYYNTFKETVINHKTGFTFSIPEYNTVNYDLSKIFSRFKDEKIKFNGKVTETIKDGNTIVIKLEYED